MKIAKNFQNLGLLLLLRFFSSSVLQSARSTIT